MGVAIVWIFFYHTGVSIPGLHVLFSVGWIGVDIFFLLSGFGCCFSLNKNSSVQSFYRRRAWRIIPTWILVLILVHLTSYALSSQFPHTFWECVQWYTGLGYWIHGIFYEWYVPTLICFYIFAPLLFRVKERVLLIGVIIAIMIGLAFDLTGSFSHLFRSYQRIPIFIMGVWTYKVYERKGSFKILLAIVLSIIGILVFGGSYLLRTVNQTLSLGIQRYSLLLFLIPFLKLISLLFDRFPSFSNPFSFLGSISFEVYLLSVNYAFAKAFSTAISTLMPRPIIKILWFAFVVVISWLLHRLINRITGRGRKSPARQ